MLSLHSHTTIFGARYAFMHSVHFWALSSRLCESESTLQVALTYFILLSATVPKADRWIKSTVTNFGRLLWGASPAVWLDAGCDK
jgi:hypothetical protein